MVKEFAVGSVPYLNAKPLVKPLIWPGDQSPVEVILEIPSKLPHLLNDGTAQAIMVSSIAALTDPEATVADDLSISTQSRVESVRLFSKVPFGQIQTLAEDRSSMTSNALTKILLDERFGVNPTSVALSPDPNEMLGQCDACVLIGDNGMRFEGANLHILDLGLAWHEMTDLPFVWAVWKGRANLGPQLVGHLQRALVESKANIERVVREAVQETGFTADQCKDYFFNVMDYHLGPRHFESLTLFGELLVKYHLISEAFIPRVIKASPQIAPSEPCFS